ncbi:sugar diacid recognition domain-containing protein [Psychromonas sp. CD1]|uniref:sugar diacid recognition domain-containing protein n=1 Tax=Psychromonas sp. CD1 TaxID=1979839 RepID=UPI000B9A261E|nr:sugar diacid recognition domain-containing protein [Psychromonas sp. CD1]
MQLNKEMAEKISIRSMRIIQHSVNVMDEFGFIIASGDPSRINCRHEGASLAINENRIIEINHAMTQQLRGVKIGINFPILFQNKIIGVVGISGEPSHVRKYGELVKMTAELIIEQAALITDIQWNKRHLEELVLQLVTSSDLSEVQLHSITQRLKIDPLQERIAIVVKVNPDNGQCLSLEHLQKVVQLLNAQERDLMVAIVSISRNEILVLKPTQFKNKKWCYSAEHNCISNLIAVLH